MDDAKFFDTGSYTIGIFILLYKGKFLCQCWLAALRKNFVQSLPCCTAREAFANDFGINHLVYMQLS